MNLIGFEKICNRAIEESKFTSDLYMVGEKYKLWMALIHKVCKRDYPLASALYEDTINKINEIQNVY